MKLKIRNKAVDWKEIYSKSTKPVWKLLPHSYTREAASINKGSKALDIGCGEGHDALYLAQQGYTTTAIDVSADAIDLLQRQALEIGVSVVTKVEDASNINLSEQYDVIVSYGFLHFAGKELYMNYVNHLKSHTNKGGIHAFYTFGDVGNFHDIGQHKYWFPNRDSLKELYKDWTIHKIDERTIKTLVKGDKEEDLYNSLIKILVQKPL